MNNDEYINKQSFLQEIRNNRPFSSDLQEQWDWKYFEAMTQDFPSKSEKEIEETFVEPIIETYYDKEWFDDLVTEGRAICSCCENEFRGVNLSAHKVTFAPDGFEPGREWATEGKIFEQENEVLDSLKKMNIPWKYCPYCGRKIMGWL